MNKTNYPGSTVRWSNRELVGKLKTSLQRKKLAVACLVIALCFFIVNDSYKAQTVIKNNKDLFSSKTVVSYLEAKNRWSPTNMISRNRIYGKARLFPNLNVRNRRAPAALYQPLAGGDTCGAGTVIGALPYNDTGTTVGAVDNYKFSPDTVAPTLTGCPTCTATGAGPAGSLPRGAIYTGTGTGPDVAYKITYSTAGSMTVTMDPTAAEDLALFVYTNVCSNNPADGIVVDDTGAGGAAESVTISSLPAGTYHIVVDGYSLGATLPGPSGPYSLNVIGTGSVIVPTAAGVTVAGKVRSANGRGLARVRILFTDSSGQIRYATTNSFGHYRMDDLRAGETYTVEVSSKRHRFDNPTRVLTLEDHVADFDFSASE